MNVLNMTTFQASRYVNALLNVRFTCIHLNDNISSLIARSCIVRSSCRLSMSKLGLGLAEISCQPFPVGLLYRRPTFITADRLFSQDKSSRNADEAVKKAVGRISEKFSEAIGLLDDARSSLNTIYFSEDMKDAEVLVVEILEEYDALISGLDPIKSTEVQRTIGLKISELKAQLKMVRDMVRE